jgi:spermidine/putrescine transport system ATP-binding protein
MTADVRIEDVTRRYGAVTALGGVSLDIAAGEFVVLLGPSGCGKTTLLSILGGFVAPSEGRVRIGGRDVTHVAPKDRPTTTVFQDYALFPHMSLLDNVAFGLRMRGVGRRTRADRAREMLAMVGLAGAEARRPHEISGGQRQRVALARALAVDPDVLLLDEPLGALDLKLRRQMQDELKAIQRRVGTTFVHVTHDQEEAMAIADRIVVMNAGRIEDAGPPEDVYMRPKTLFSAAFMGEVNRIPGRGAGAAFRTALGELPLAADGPRVLCVRPEAIGPAGPLPLGRARVTDAAFFGTHHRCRLAPLAAPELTLIAHLPQAAHPRPGDEIDLFASAHVLMEDA